MTQEFDKRDEDERGKTPEPTEESRDSTTPEEAPEILSPGYLLRSARERERFSVADLSAQTLLSKSVIEKLENNDLESLGQPVFVRGYYRKCGKVLGIDEHQLMEAYAAHTGESVEAPRPTQPISLDVRPMDATPRERSSLLKPLLIAVIIAGAVGIWFALSDGVEQMTGTLVDSDYTELELNPAPSSAVVQPQLPSQAETAQAAGVAGAEPDAVETQLDGAGDGSAEPGEAPAVAEAEILPQPIEGEGQPAAEAQPAEAADESQAATVAEDALQLSFEGSSWVRISDASGRRLLDGVFSQGEARTLEGRPPYEVILGNAPVVRVALGGEAIDISQYIEGNNTARFVVESEN